MAEGNCVEGLDELVKHNFCDPPAVRETCDKYGCLERRGVIEMEVDSFSQGFVTALKLDLS